MENELQKLIEDKQIIRLEKCPDDLYISPVVITVKKDKSIKIALDSKELNKAIHKNKYQMQSIEHLTDSLAMQIASNKNNEGPWWFSKIDLKYAYSQIPLDDSIAEHCNFNILGGKATGTYRFINGFYGLTDMPATFQKTIDKTLEGCKNYFAFLDDILIATKGKLKEHEETLDIILDRLNKEGLAISLQKCEFAKQEIEWLGFKITPHGVTPLITKTEALQKLDIPKTLKQLRSFMGSIHHLIKFIPHLAEISEPLRPLLKKENVTTSNKLKWEEKHTKTFENIKTQIEKIVENKPFDVDKDTRVKCDASKFRIRGNTRAENRQYMAHHRIRKPIPKYSRTKIQYKRIRTTSSSLVSRTLQTLPTRIGVHTPNGSPGITDGTKRKQRKQNLPK